MSDLRGGAGDGEDARMWVSNRRTASRSAEWIEYRGDLSEQLLSSECVLLLRWCATTRNGHEISTTRIHSRLRYSK
jgi:hypothetical protein